jgi:hypothetical protein
VKNTRVPRSVDYAAPTFGAFDTFYRAQIWIAVVLTYKEVGNAGVVGNIRRPYTATIPYIASDGLPPRLHARWRSVEQSRLC